MTRFVRPREAWTRLGISRTTFYTDIVPKRLQVVRLGPKATGVVEAELEALMAEMMKDRGTRLSKALKEASKAKASKSRMKGSKLPTSQTI
jgi:predicted DNA-binding transcriptional regulator AlpA